MRRLLSGLVALLAVMSSAYGATPDPLADFHIRSELQHLPATRVDVYRLWPFNGKDDPAPPTLTAMRPHVGRANGTAVIIAPGGAYVGIAGMLEGVEPAAWFTARGVTAFILNYRVGPKARLPIPLADGARAMRFVRANAAAFGIDPARIGMMGFSAGGHLAATTAVDATPGKPDSADTIERARSRPDFLILAYPWLEGLQIRADGTSQYCEFALRFGSAQCQPQDYAGFLPVAHVAKTTPPTFIYHTTDDDLVPVSGSVRFYQALIEHGVPAEFHAYESGKHGSGLAGGTKALETWPELLGQWMRDHGWLDTPSSAE